MTGSFTNHLLSGTVGGPVPKVGMGCTILWYTDRSPATIIAVSPSGKTVTVQEDKSTREDTNGMSESQNYTYERDPEGTIRVFRFSRVRHVWNSDGLRLRIGDRNKYHDYGF